MSVLVDFVKFLLSFRNQDTTSFKNTQKYFLLNDRASFCNCAYVLHILEWSKILWFPKDSTNQYCAVPAKIHTHPMEGHLKFLGGGGSQKAKFKEQNL